MGLYLVSAKVEVSLTQGDMKPDSLALYRYESKIMSLALQVFNYYVRNNAGIATGINVLSTLINDQVFENVIQILKFKVCCKYQETAL